MLPFVTIIVVLLSHSCGTFSASNVCGENDVRVKIKHGNIRGSWMVSKSGRCFQAYRGIPYAKPPLGDLRFRAPVEPDKWNHVLDATQDAPACIQKNIFFSATPEIEGLEDCLYLNVYTPKIHYTNRSNQLLPVMVYIHYGGFFAGSGRSDYHGPEYFMDKDVILVTFNYRLGALGFLSTYDDASPGNWGLKDQVAALRWVQDNIIRFGGNNKKVTLFGQSAGGGSTHHHILSPSSKGLFQAAISQSGSALAIWAKPQRELAAIIAKTQAYFVGCRNDTDSYTMVDCLRKVPATELIASADRFRILRLVPLMIYTTAIENRTKVNPEPFITEDPVEIIQKGQFQNVPWIIGVTGEEGILEAAPFVREHGTLEYLNQNFDTIFPNILGLSLSIPESDIPQVWNAVQTKYFPEKRINTSNPETIKGLIDVISDRIFFYSTYQSALLHSWHGHDKLRFYYFDYKGEYTYGTWFAATNETVNYDWGVSHCDELLYLFTTKYFPNLKASKDKEMIRNMIAFFTNFAIHGNPTPNIVSGSNTTRWDHLPSIVGKPTMENSDLHYLWISGKHDGGPIRFEMRNNFHPTRMSFWAKLNLLENVPNLH